jgi:hypothetical protein
VQLPRFNLQQRKKVTEREREGGGGGGEGVCVYVRQSFPSSDFFTEERNTKRKVM